MSRAERDLASIWLSSRLRIAVELAAQAIDDALRDDAMSVGESRARDDVRVVIVWPLMAEVQVNFDQRRCAVVRIRRVD
ncbi:MAG: hypothetical protein SH850_30310 [Planctomycetaceae bacterium]|nr:hypothetical protein [Planctomycetaceae bacterium]